MKRLFTFGCSFTGFRWPTWADILGREFDYYENWGTLGAGNQFIFNSLIECKTRHKFTPDDHIMIMWTNVAREDRYIDRQWINPGNFLTQSFYNKDYVKKVYCERGFLMRDLATITATIDLLKSWDIKYELMSMIPISNIDQYEVKKADNIEDILTLYKESINQIKPSVFEVVFNNDWWSRSSTFFNQEKIEQCYKNNTEDKFFSFLNDMKATSRPDPHPVPEEHLEYLQKVLPNYQISDNTKSWIKNYQLGDTFNKHFPVRI
jgi:hypothetical protein